MSVKCEEVIFEEKDGLLDIVVKGIILGCGSLLSVVCRDVCFNSLENVLSGFFDEGCVVSGKGCFLM